LRAETASSHLVLVGSVVVFSVVVFHGGLNMTFAGKPEKKTDIRTTFVVGSLISVIAMAGYGSTSDEPQLSSENIKNEAELRIETESVKEPEPDSAN